jgi:GNAT superfamily N-acetyltransferase
MSNPNWQSLANDFQFIPKEVSFRSIRDLNEYKTDRDFLLSVYKSTRWQEVLQAPWADKQRHDFLEQQFDAQHKHYQTHYSKADYLIILQHIEKIGRIYIDRDNTSICLIDIALLPQFQKKGLGTKIINELLLEAQKTNKKVVIHVENYNPAYQLYLNLGFQQIEDKGVYQYMEWYPTKS